MIRWLTFFVVPLILVVERGAPAQRTITVGPVPGHDYPTIQSAIDAANTGDLVIVSPAVYPENIHFGGKSIVLRGTDPKNPGVVNGTVIDGGQRGPVVTFSGTETQSCRLSGFTIRNGKAGQGGGICGGGGSTRTLATIEYNVIAANRALRTSPNDVGDGGGIAFCNGIIQYNRIIGNAAGRVEGLFQYEIGDGGGLAYCDGPIQNNEIVGNEASEDAGGLKDCDGLIQNNLIAGNRAYDEGGGLSGCDGAIINNTIVKNRVEWRILSSNIYRETAGRGGGLNHCLGVIRNCIVWGNYANERTPSYPPSHQTYESNAPSFTCIEDSSVGGVGNIFAGPRFVDWNGGNYRLRGDSPCVDAGIDGHWWLWEVRDLSGHGRRAQARVDMGCYEFNSAPDTDGDLLPDYLEASHGTDPNNPDSDGDGLRDGLEVIRGADPQSITPPALRRVPADHPTIQEAIGLSRTGDTIVVAPGQYVGPVQFCGIDVTVRSEAPDDPASVDATVLNGDGDGPVVLFLGYETEVCVLEGFTIQGGRGDHGGGVRGGTSSHHTQATIRKNTIKNNWVLRGGAGIGWCDGRIENNRIVDNRADNDGAAISQCDGAIRANLIAQNKAGGDGGGIAHCDGSIEDNQIIWNTAGKYGGAIARSRATIRGNTVSGNSAELDGGGLTLCNGPIVSNAISDNTAKGDGGGISNCDGVVLNNLISGNSAGDDGGGIHRSDGALIGSIIVENSCRDSGGGIAKSEGYIQNCTVVKNIAHGESGGVDGCDGVIRDCILWGNQGSVPVQIKDSTTPTYCCITDWTEGGEGNISADPQLIGNTWRLSALSPCIDAGDPASEFNDKLLPPGLGSARCDMGAYGGPYNDGWPTADKPPDLSGSLLSIEPNPVIAGRPILFSGGVYNQAPNSTAPGFWVEFWAVNNDRSVFLCDSIAFAALNGGKSATFGTTWPLRMAYSDIPSGDYAIEMRIDAGNAVLESNEANNVIRLGACSIRKAQPNLTARDFDFSPEDADPLGGTMLRFAGQLVNTTQEPVTQAFWIEFRIWPKGRFDASGPLLCESHLATGTIGPNASLDLGSLALRPSYDLEPGVYWVGVVIDATNAVGESNERDNVLWRSDRNLYVGPRPAGVRRWSLYR